MLTLIILNMEGGKQTSSLSIHELVQLQVILSHNFLFFLEVNIYSLLSIITLII